VDFFLLSFALSFEVVLFGAVEGETQPTELEWLREKTTSVCAKLFHSGSFMDCVDDILFMAGKNRPYDHDCHTGGVDNPAAFVRNDCT
jgi:hypothetical protein